MVFDHYFSMSKVLLVRNISPRAYIVTLNSCVNILWGDDITHMWQPQQSAQLVRPAHHPVRYSIQLPSKQDSHRHSWQDESPMHLACRAVTQPMHPTRQISGQESSQTPLSPHESHCVSNDVMSSVTLPCRACLGHMLMIIPLRNASVDSSRILD